MSRRAWAIVAAGLWIAGTGVIAVLGQARGGRPGAIVPLFKDEERSDSQTMGYMATATRALEGHTGLVWAVKVSPDGKLLASGGTDKVIRIWDLPTGKLVKTLAPSQGSVMSLSFTSDSKRLAAGERQGHVQIWDLATGQVTAQLEARGEGIFEIAFLPKDEKLVVGGMDGFLRVWDVAKRKELVTASAEDIIVGMGIDPEAKRAVVSTYSGAAKIFDLETGRATDDIPGSGAKGFGALWADGGKLAIVHQEQHTLVYDAGQKKVVADHTELHGGFKAAVAADGVTAAAAAGIHVLAWNPKTGREIMSMRGCEGGIRALDISPDGRYVVAAGGKDASEGALTASSADDPRVYVWDLHAGEIYSPGKPVSSFAATGDLKLAAAGMADGTLLAFDVKGPGQKLGEGRALKNHTAAVTGLAFVPGGVDLASTSEDKTIRLWDGSSGREIDHWQAMEPTLCPRWLGSKKFVVAAGDKVLVVGHGMDKPDVFATATGPIVSLAASADGKWVLAAPKSGPAMLWSTADPANARKISAGATPEIDAVTFLSDGNIAIHDTRYGVLRADTATGAVVSQFKQSANRAFALYPGIKPGELVALGNGAELLDLTAGRTVAGFRGCLGNPVGARLADDGSAMMYASDLGGIHKDVISRPVVFAGKWHPEPRTMAVTADGHVGVSVSASGRTADRDSVVEVRDMRTGAVFKSYPVKGGCGAGLSADGKRVVIATDSTLAVADVAAGNSKDLKIEGFRRVNEFPRLVVVSPDGKLAALALAGEHDAGLVLVVSTETGARTAALAGHGTAVWGIAWSPDSQRLLTRTGCNSAGQAHATPVDHAARLWEVSTGKELRTFAITDRDFAACWFSPSGKDIYLVDEKGYVQNYDGVTLQFKRIICWNVADSGIVGAAALSPDGTKIFAAAGGARQLLMWDCQSGQVKTFPGPGTVLPLAFFRDGAPALWRCDGNTGSVWTAAESAP